jgi:hypothetical protein
MIVLLADGSRVRGDGCADPFGRPHERATWGLEAAQGLSQAGFHAVKHLSPELGQGGGGFLHGQPRPAAVLGETDPRDPFEQRIALMVLGRRGKDEANGL